MIPHAEVSAGFDFTLKSLIALTTEMTATRQVTLEEMLLARDCRQIRQQELHARWPEASVVVLTVVAPGNEKCNRNTAAVAFAACDVLSETFAPTCLLWQVRDLPTGFELWIVSSLSPSEAKRLAVGIEETHPLGRLMDIDVIGADLRPVSRAELGLAGRSCLICGDNARICMRASRHSYSDLINKISETVDAYVSKI